MINLRKLATVVAQSIYQDSDSAMEEILEQFKQYDEEALDFAYLDDEVEYAAVCMAKLIVKEIYKGE